MNNAVLLGILSDSHGRVDTTRTAVRLLLEKGCTILIHLGDLGSEGVIDELVSQPPHTAHVVLGNCDDDRLGRYAELVGVANDHPLGVLEVAGRRIAFTHGHIESAMRQALAEGVDYLLHGHTHEVRDERIGQTRIINPGALQRAARYTAAVLDPAHDVLEFLEIARR